MSVNVGPGDVGLVPLYVGTGFDLCLKKEMTLRDGDPARYSSRRCSEIQANRLHERTYLEDGQWYDKTIGLFPYSLASLCVIIVWDTATGFVANLPPFAILAGR